MKEVGKSWWDVYDGVINSLTGGDIAEYDASLRNFRARQRLNMAVLCFDLYQKEKEHIFWKETGPLNIWGFFKVGFKIVSSAFLTL